MNTSDDITLPRNVEFGPPVVMTVNFHNLSFLGDLYSRDTSIQGTENLAPEKMFIYITFVFVNSILTGHLYSGERDSFSGSR